MWAELVMCVVFLIAIDSSSQSGQDKGKETTPSLSEYPSYFQNLLSSEHEPPNIPQQQLIYGHPQQYNPVYEMPPLQNQIEPVLTVEQVRQVRRAEKDRVRNLARAEHFAKQKAKLPPEAVRRPEPEQVYHPIKLEFTVNRSEAKRLKQEEKQVEREEKSNQKKIERARKLQAKKSEMKALLRMQSQGGESNHPAGSSFSSQQDHTLLPPNMNNYEFHGKN